MQRTRHVAVTVLLTLFATACSATPTSTAIGQGSGSADGVDPQWHLTQEELAASGATTPDPTPSAAATTPPSTTTTGTTASTGTVQTDEPGEFAEELNDGAAFDIYVMELFPSARPEQFGALQTVISGFCNGLVDDDSIDQLTRDAAIQDKILAIPDDDCDSIEMSAILMTGSPVAASTWDEAVRRRFARTVWWYDEANFAGRALAACQAGQSASSLGSDLDLGLSVTVELAAFTRHGDCALLTVEDGAAVQTTSADESEIVARPVDGDVTLYFLRAGEGQSAGDRKRDLYALAVETGEVTRLTTDTDVSRTSLSPDASQIAFTADIEDSSETDMLYVLDIATSDIRAIAEINYITDLAWTPDGSAVIHSVESADGIRMIGRLDLASGTSSVIVEPSMDSAWAQGVSGSHLLYQESDGWNTLLVRHDLRTGETIDWTEIQYGRTSIALDGSLLVHTERQTGEMATVDLTSDTMILTPLASGPGLEAGVRISPDNRFVAYGVGPEFGANEIFLTDLSAPESRIHLTLEIDTTDVGSPVWAPDSQSLFFSDGSFDSESIYMVTIDGVVTDLGQIGRPLFATAS